MTAPFNDILEHCENHDGFCTECDDFTVVGGVDAGAEGYRCPDCGNFTVFGTEIAVLTGRIEKIVSGRR